MSLPLQLGRYGLVGAVGTAAHYALMGLLMAVFGIAAVAASTAGAIAGALVNYVLNYYYTFCSDKHHGEAIVKFWAVAGLGWGVNAAVLAGGLDGLGLAVIPAQLLATGVVFLLTFVLNRLWTFA